MRDHELELIAALAEGRLEDESEARALIATSAEHRAEYEAQKQALDALGNVTTANLSELERTSLHREVWSELRSPRTTPGPTPWYSRWAPVAAGMFVVVGLVAVLNQVGGSDELPPVAANLDSGTETTAAAESSPGGQDTADGGGEAEAPTEGGQSEETATTQVAASQTIDIEDLVAADLNRALTALDHTYYSDEAESIRTSVSADPELRTFDENDPPAGLTDCVDQAGISGYSIVGAHPAPSDEEGESAPEDANPYIVVKPDDQDLAEAPLAFVDMASCEVIYVDE
ncbi:MAG TPA: hypothetical protein VFP42_04400 [Acidimicrobiia bacterium]|nr:hypothetical protein [Acidimicrobiia bacterium]